MTYFVVFLTRILWLVNVYFVRGIAADRRIFKNIRLPDGCNAIHLDWITPIRGESLAEYAVRLGKTIDAKTAFALIGLSMGGMMVSEMSKVYHPAKTILISSVPSYRDLPFFLTWPGKLRIHHLIPTFIIKSGFLMKQLFSTESKEEKELVMTIIRESDPTFIRWAVNAIMRWDGDRPATKLIHIHGAADNLLPAKYTTPTHLIGEGGHLLVMNKADEVNNILTNVLQRSDFYPPLK